MGIFDQILQDIPQEDRAILVKYPQLKTAVEDLETKNTNWNQWATENYDFQSNATKAEVELRSQLESETQRALALEQQVGTGDDMTFEQIEADLNRRGYIKKADVDSAIAPHLKAVEDKANTAVNQTAVGMQFLYTKVTPMVIDHSREFPNETLDLDKFFKHMEDTKSYGNPKAAYDAFVAPQREAARQKAAEALATKHKEELESATKAAEEKGRKEALEQSGMSRLPVDQRGPSEGMSPNQSRIIAAAKKEDGSFVVPKEAELGDGSLAVIGAEMLRAGKLSSSDGVQ
jgi:hypothetical protein